MALSALGVHSVRVASRPPLLSQCAERTGGLEATSLTGTSQRPKGGLEATLWSQTLMSTGPGWDIRYVPADLHTCLAGRRKRQI